MSRFIKAVAPLVLTGSLLLSGSLLAEQEQASDFFPGATLEAEQFDFLIGDWDCQWIGFNTQGQQNEPMNCQWQGRYTFGKRMVQDDFRLFNNQAQEVFSGTTLRTYTPHKKRWDFVFLASQAGHWPVFHGNWEGSEMKIHAENEDKQGKHIVRIAFKNITNESFLWTSDKSYDQGKNWQPSGMIKAKRKK